MTPIEMIEQARQAVQDGKLSWQDYYALVLALAVDPKLETITAARVDGDARQGREELTDEH